MQVSRRDSIHIEDVIRDVSDQILPNFPLELQSERLAKIITQVNKNLLEQPLPLLVRLEREVKELEANSYSLKGKIVAILQNALPTLPPLKRSMECLDELDRLFEAGKIEETLALLRTIEQPQMKVGLFRHIGIELLKLKDFDRVAAIIKEMDESPQMCYSTEKRELIAFLKGMQQQNLTTFPDFVAAFRKELEATRSLDSAFKVISGPLFKFDLEQMESFEKSYRSITEKHPAPESLVYADARAQGKPLNFEIDLSFEALTWTMVESCLRIKRKEKILELLAQNNIQAVLQHRSKMDIISKVTIEVDVAIVKYYQSKNLPKEAFEHTQKMADSQQKHDLNTEFFKEQLLEKYDVVRDVVPLQLRANLPTRTQTKDIIEKEMDDSQARAKVLVNCSLPELQLLLQQSETRLNLRRTEFENALRTLDERIIATALERKQEEMKSQYSIQCMIKAKQQEQNPREAKKDTSNCIIS